MVLANISQKYLTTSVKVRNFAKLKHTVIKLDCGSYQGMLKLLSIVSI